MFGPLVADYILGSAHSATSNLLALNKITGLEEIDPVTNLTKGVLLGTALNEFGLGQERRLIPGAQAISIFRPLLNLQLMELGDEQRVLIMMVNVSNPVISRVVFKMKFDMITSPTPSIKQIRIDGQPIVRRFIPLMIRAGQILRTEDNLLTCREYLGRLQK